MDHACGGGKVHPRDGWRQTRTGRRVTVVPSWVRRLGRVISAALPWMIGALYVLTARDYRHDDTVAAGRLIIIGVPRAIRQDCRDRGGPRLATTGFLRVLSRNRRGGLAPTVRLVPPLSSRADVGAGRPVVLHGSGVVNRFLGDAHWALGRAKAERGTSRWDALELPFGASPGAGHARQRLLTRARANGASGTPSGPRGGAFWGARCLTAAGASSAVDVAGSDLVGAIAWPRPRRCGSGDGGFRQGERRRRCHRHRRIDDPGLTDSLEPGSRHEPGPYRGRIEICIRAGDTSLP